MATSGELPTGVVTFVLTDIVGSTELWEQCPDDMATALDVHDSVITDAVERHGGVVVKSRGEGDSTFSVFQRASDAIRAAYEAQVAWMVSDWPYGARIRVRVAVHTGEATERDGDYVGTTVNRAARLRGIAEPGEIVVSAPVAHLVADHLPLDTQTRSLGPVRLRGLEREEEAFVLVGPGLGHPVEGARGEIRVDLLAENGVTRRERDIFEAVAVRLTNAEIATRFSVSERTVETHVSSLLRKLGVSNRLELAALAAEVGTAPTLDLPPMLVMSAQRSQCLGRAAERTILLDCWVRAAAGQVGLAVITGEAGIGKSRLAADLAVEVNKRGGQVLLGASTDGASAPYQPFSEALVDTIALTPERQLRADAGRHLEPLARALPSVGARLGTLAPAAGLDPLGDRYASQVGIAAFLAATAQRQPTLLVLEDLHWASAVTRQAVLHVARTGGAAPLLVVATARDVAPDLDDELQRWLADAARLPVCDIVPLSGLDLEATGTLLAELGGSVDPSVALHDTGGNPLFLRELATAGTSSPTLRDLLAERFSRLSDEDLDVVDAGAILGESVRVDLVAAAVGRPVDEVLDALQRACDEGLMEPVSGRPGDFAFAHALYRSTRYDSLSAGRRLRLHAAVAAALLPRQDDPTVLPDLARHACVAAPLGGAEAAMELARRAGLASRDAGDHADAARHFQRALDVTGLLTRPDDGVVLELTIRLGDALVLFDLRRGHEVLRDGIRLARRRDDAEAFADAVCSMTAEYGSFSVGRLDDGFIALAEEALERLPADASGWRSRLLGTLGTHLALGGSSRRGQDMVREALAIAREIEDPLRVVEAALCSRFTLGVFEIDERLSALGEAVELCRLHDWAMLTSIAAAGLAVTHRAAGDFDAMRRADALVRESADASPLSALTFEALDAMLTGELDRAERVIVLTDEITANFGAQHLYSGSIQLTAALLRGAAPYSWLEPFAEGQAFVFEGVRAFLAFSYLQAGQLEAARAQLDEVSATGFKRVPVGMVRAQCLALWAEVAAGVQDTEAMTQLLEELDPIAGRLADSAGMVWFSIDQVRAQLALGLGDAAAAESIATGAVAASRSRGTPIFLARELVVLAAARREQGAAPAEVAELVDEALSIADLTGAQLIRHEAIRMGVAS